MERVWNISLLILGERRCIECVSFFFVIAHHFTCVWLKREGEVREGLLKCTANDEHC